jgi:hypothetical protein
MFKKILTTVAVATVSTALFAVNNTTTTDPNSQRTTATSQGFGNGSTVTNDTVRTSRNTSYTRDGVPSTSTTNTRTDTPYDQEHQSVTPSQQGQSKDLSASDTLNPIQRSSDSRTMTNPQSLDKRFPTNSTQQPRTTNNPW